jgi:hypothetical protein
MSRNGISHIIGVLVRLKQYRVLDKIEKIEEKE